MTSMRQAVSRLEENKDTTGQTEVGLLEFTQLCNTHAPNLGIGCACRPCHRNISAVPSLLLLSAPVCRVSESISQSTRRRYGQQERVLLLAIESRWFERSRSFVPASSPTTDWCGHHPKLSRTGDTANKHPVVGLFLLVLVTRAKAVLTTVQLCHCPPVASPSPKLRATECSIPSQHRVF
jgi:hypothetical protein